MVNTKSNYNLFGDTTKFKKWYKNLSTIDKRILFSILGTITIILFINLTIETIRNYDNDLSQPDCNRLRIEDVRYYLELQEENNILAFIYAFSTPFIILIGAIAISWIIHGVGFRIIR